MDRGGYQGNPTGSPVVNETVLVIGGGDVFTRQTYFRTSLPAASARPLL